MGFYQFLGWLGGGEGKKRRLEMRRWMTIIKLL